MKLISILTAFSAILSCSAALGSPLWTETFDNGVGRFDITTGQGDTLFTHNATQQNMDGVFIRQVANGTGEHDRRLTDVGLQDTSILPAFAFDWTPLSGGINAVAPDLLTAQVGLFDSTTNLLKSGVWIFVTDNGGFYEIKGPGLRSPDIGQWIYGHTYRVSFYLDATSATMTTAELIGSDFVLQDTFTFPIVGSQTYDRVGFGSLLDSEVGSDLHATIDNISFTPEPSTALLLTVASLLALRRRRGEQSE